MGKTVIVGIAVVAVFFIGAGGEAMAAPSILKGCSAGQTVAFDGSNWVCADFPALTGLVRVQADFPANDGNLSTTATQEVTASCPAGTKVVGGGYAHLYGGPTGVIRDNIPTIDSGGWLVSGQISNGASWRLSAVAMCADAD